MHLLPHSVRLERTLHRTSVRRLNFAVRSQFRREAYLPDGEQREHLAVSDRSFTSDVLTDTAPDRVMRRTGKLYSLTLCSCLLTVVAATLVALWNENSATWHLWLDVMPQGFGMASVITTTLIVRTQRTSVCPTRHRRLTARPRSRL